MRVVVCFIFLGIYFFGYAQKDQSFWKDVEIEFGFNPTISVGIESADYTRDVLPYLTPQNDKLNLLKDEYAAGSTIGISAYGNDYGDCCWSPPMPNSVLYSLKVQKPLSTKYVKDLFYVGAFVQYGKNSLGTSLRNGDYKAYSDYPYRNTQYFTETHVYDTVMFQFSDTTQTYIFNRTKMVGFDNPRNTIQAGINLKTVLYKSKKERFRLSVDLGASFISATSRDIKIYSQYFDFESLTNYEYVYNEKDNNIFDNFYNVQHVNNTNNGESIMHVTTPLLYATSYSFGLGIDYKFFKKLPLNFGLNVITASQVFKRAGKEMGSNRMFTVGYGIIYTLKSE